MCLKLTLNCAVSLVAEASFCLVLLESDWLSRVVDDRVLQQVLSHLCTGELQAVEVMRTFIFLKALH